MLEWLFLYVVLPYETLLDLIFMMLRASDLAGSEMELFNFMVGSKDRLWHTHAEH